MLAFWITAVVFSIVILGGVYLVESNRYGHEAAVSMLPGVGVLLVGGIGIAAALRFLPYDWNERAWLALGMAGPLGFLWQLLTRGRRERQAGAVLMDLGRDRVSKIPGPAPAAFGWFLTALVCLGGSIRQSGETVGLSAENLELFSMGVFFLGFGGYFLLSWHEGRQIRENGISWYGNLFRWDRFQKCAWAGEVLSLSVETPIAFWTHSFGVRISAEQKEAVDQILRDRLQTER